MDFGRQVIPEAYMKKRPEDTVNLPAEEGGTALTFIHERLNRRINAFPYEATGDKI